jgi:hypothetical protein
MGGFEGYARDCVREGPLCWPLGPDNVLRERIRAAAEYWSSWDGPDTPWKVIQEEQIAAYQRQLGEHEKYYAIDGGEWPPKALLRTPVPDGQALTTVGVALRPQPRVEMAGEAAAAYRRIELGIGFDDELAPRFELVARYLSAQSRLPWARITWLGAGHTIPCDAFPGTDFTAVLLKADLPGLPRIKLPPFRGHDVTLLWAIPITGRERDFAIENGSDDLVARLAQSSVGWSTRCRRSVV